MTKSAPPDEFHVDYSSAKLEKHPEWKPHLVNRGYSFGQRGAADAPVPPPEGNTPEEIANDLERRSQGNVPAEFREITGLVAKIKRLGRQRLEALSAIADSPNGLYRGQIKEELEEFGLPTDINWVGKIVGYGGPKGKNEESCHRDNLVARELVVIDKPQPYKYRATNLGRQVAKVLQGSDLLGADTGAEDEPDEEDDYIPGDENRGEEVKKIQQQIHDRQGQPEFRKKLIERYKGRCVVTGCQLENVLEAAHIVPYRREKDNHPANGLLLRSDIHTLFDLYLLGIHPETLKVGVHPDLPEEYLRLEDQSLYRASNKRPSREALKRHYEQFRKRRRDPA